MKTVVIGGSGSGKSNFAENITLKNKLQHSKKLYVATMEHFSSEAKIRIEKHKLQRLGKGFKTIEVYSGMDKLRLDTHYDFILLECISNLVSNYMFSKNSGNILNYVTNSINKLKEHSDHLIVVSNDIFNDTLNYDNKTLEYIKTLGQVNCYLAKTFDNVIECQCNNAIIQKGAI